MTDSYFHPCNKAVSNEISIAEAIAKFTAVENAQKTAEQVAIEKYEAEYESLKKKAEDLATDIATMHALMLVAYDHGFCFKDRDKHLFGEPKNCIGVAFTDTWYHRLGFFDKGFCHNVQMPEKDTIRMGFAGGGANGNSVFVTINTKDHSKPIAEWTFGDHYQYRNWYLKKFLADFPDFKEQFYASIRKVIG